MISYYFFIKGSKSPRFKHPLLEETKKFSLVDFTERHCNLQCTTLAGIPWNRIFSRSSRIILNLAKKHLFYKLDMYGILEQMDEFQDIIESRYGWTKNSTYALDTKTKVRPKVADLTESQVIRMKELLSLDIELYEEAKERLKTI